MNIFSSLILLSLLVGCSSEENARAAKDALSSLIYDLDTSISNVVKAGDLFASSLAVALSKRPVANTPILYSSVYVPKRSRKMHKQLLEMKSYFATLDKGFKDYVSSSSFLSWAYLYDSKTKLVMIYPSTNTQVLFGEDLIFDDFYFYKSAVSNYPNGVFSEIKDDINGTGKILIYTKMVKSESRPDSKFTVSLDVNISRLIKNSFSKEIVNSKSFRGKRFFAISYTEGASRIDVLDRYSVDPSVFNSETTDVFNESRITIDWVSKLKANQLSTEELKFNKVVYQCFFDQVKAVKFNVVFCVEE